MKRFLTFLLVIVTMVLPGFAEKYNVTFDKASPETVIKKLKAETGMGFVYQKDILNKAVGSISVEYKDLSLEQLLHRIINQKMHLAYEIVDNTVVISVPDAATNLVRGNISGIVYDREENEPLAGVTVTMDGTSKSTVTDIDGRFIFTGVKAVNPIITVSFVGMKPISVMVTPKNQSNLRFDMVPQITFMSDVVVTGYQSIKREKSTGAYQIISSDDLERRYSGSVIENLEGQVPGLVTYNNGIKSGEDAMTIRGTSSFQAVTKPLVVVDGLPIEGGIESVNPYDIKNITVLKDAAAAAIYGARASNGIIVITTKQATDERISVDFNTDITISERQSYDNLGWASASDLIELEKYQFNSMLNNEDQSFYGELMNRWNDNRIQNFSPALRLLVRNHLGDLSDSDLQNEFSRMSSNDYRREWRDVMNTTKVLQQYNLALRVKSKNLQSSIVMNYKRNNHGMVKEHDDAITLKYRGDLKAAKWLDLSFGVNVLSERGKKRPASIYGRRGINSFRPYESMYNADGSLNMMEAGIDPNLDVLNDEYYGLKDVTFNLMDDYNLNWQRDRRTNLRSYVNGTFKLLPGWTASGFFQYEDIYYKSDITTSGDSFEMRRLYNLYTGMVTKYDTYYDWWSGEMVTDSYEAVDHLIPAGGMLETLTNEGSYYTFRAQTQYNRSLFEKHDIDILGGFEFRESRQKSYSNLYLGYDEKTQSHTSGLVNWQALRDTFGASSVLGDDYTMMGAPNLNDYKSTDVLHRFYSIYFTGNYVYDNRYAVSGSWRVDKTDLFGADPKFRGRPLWSAGLSWNAHNEAFLKDVTWINTLKPRISYGITGNIDSSASSVMSAGIGTNWNNGEKNAYLITPPNEQLRWEKTATWNFGVDFAFCNYRLSGSLDYYHKKGTDLLSWMDLDVTTGWSVLLINNGEMVNNGLELQLNGRILDAKNRNSLGIRAGLNFAYNQNKVTKVNHTSPDGYTELEETTLHEGYPIHSLFSYRFAGLERDGNVFNYTWRDREGNVHDSNLYSTDFTPDEVVFSGSLDPRFISSFTPELTYAGFSLSAMMTYYGGHKMRADTDRWDSSSRMYGYGGNTLARELDFWRSGENTAFAPNGYLTSNINGTYRYADCNVVTADYLKVRNIVLAYTFPKTLTRHFGVNELRLRVQMNNVATWARNSLGLDPEAVNPVTGGNGYKTPRSYTFSLFINL